MSTILDLLTNRLTLEEATELSRLSGEYPKKLTFKADILSNGVIATLSIVVFSGGGTLATFMAIKRDGIYPHAFGMMTGFILFGLFGAIMTGRHLFPKRATLTLFQDGFELSSRSRYYKWAYCSEFKSTDFKYHIISFDYDFGEEANVSEKTNIKTIHISNIFSPSSLFFAELMNVWRRHCLPPDRRDCRGN